MVTGLAAYRATGYDWCSTLLQREDLFLVIRVLNTVNAKGRHTRHSRNKRAQRVSCSQLQVAALMQECV